MKAATIFISIAIVSVACFFLAAILPSPAADSFRIAGGVLMLTFAALLWLAAKGMDYAKKKREYELQEEEAQSVQEQQAETTEPETLSTFERIPETETDDRVCYTFPIVGAFTPRQVPKDLNLEINE